MMTLVGGTIPPNYQLNFTQFHWQKLVLDVTIGHFRNWASIQNKNLTNYGIHQACQATEIRTLISTTTLPFFFHGKKYLEAVMS